MAVDEAALDAFLSDPSTPGGDLNPTGEAPAAPASTPEASAASQAEVEHTIPEPSAEADTFDRAYVEKLRRESAGYRDRAKKYNDVFEGYEEDAVEEWLTLATTLKSDPKTAAARFQELAEAINAQYQEEAAAAEVAAVEGDAPLTRKELEAFWAAKQAESEQAMLVKKIELDAKELGYEKGSDDYELLLFEASRLPNGSIQAAHEKIEARNKAILDAHLAKLGMQPNPKVPVQGAAPSGERQIKTFEEANAALDAWLAQQF